MSLPFMVDIEIVAKLLNISLSAAYHQASRGTLPIQRHKFGKAVRFKRTDIEAFIGCSLEEALGEEVA